MDLLFLFKAGDEVSSVGEFQSANCKVGLKSKRTSWNFTTVLLQHEDEKDM